MQQIHFKNTKTSSLGFGCSLLTRNNSIKDAILNLETAYECGIRHFDVARLYGFGQAEEIIGKFSQNKRENITITSKTGLTSRELPLFALPLINYLRKIIKANKQLNKTTNNVINTGLFTPKSIQKDLEKSLRKLKTDYIDFYLLHEAEIAHANIMEICNTLVIEKGKGKILHFGIASNTSKIVSQFSNLYNEYQIIQHNSGLENKEINDIRINNDDRLRIIYSIFSNQNMEYAEKHFEENGFSNSIDYILKKFKSLNSNGITLFSSTSNNNIKATAKSWNN
jgi:aryl-alcohol dehydrogenase-like predicted oxidoreductase